MSTSFVSVVFCFDNEPNELETVDDSSKKPWGDDFYTIRIEPEEKVKKVDKDIRLAEFNILDLKRDSENLNETVFIPKTVAAYSNYTLSSQDEDNTKEPSSETVVEEEIQKNLKFANSSAGEENFAFIDQEEIVEPRTQGKYTDAQMGDREVNKEVHQETKPQTSGGRSSARKTGEMTQKMVDHLMGGNPTEKEMKLMEFYSDPDRDGYMSIGLLLQQLENGGIHVDDPRLAPMVQKLKQYSEEQGKSAKDIYSLDITRDQFLKCIPDCFRLLLRCLESQLVIPDWPEFCEQIENIFEEVKHNDKGKNADYIPQLARVDPNQWGVSICSVDGQRAHWGNTDVPFCIQSVSKAFNYAVALAEHEPDFVHKYIGQEPSGRPFNAIELDKKDRPHNPMINAGAIVTSSLIQSKKPISERFEHTRDQYRKFAGGGFVGFDNAVYQSERNTADRNFSLAYFMRENHCFPEGTDLQETLELYFQLCSVLVTAESASVMAATLANGGVCPLTGDKVIEGRACRDVLSLMYSCGMYDYSGQFAFNVGLPAKSGVGGLIITVVPNVLGIATWSPRLDECGNSVRGVHFNEELIERFNFHNYDLVASEKKRDPRKSKLTVKKELISNFLFAASAGDRNAMKGLLLEGVNVDECDYDGRRPLHVAAADGRSDAVHFLLHFAKADPHVKDRWSRTPLDEAVAFKHEQCAEIIRKWIKL